MRRDPLEKSKFLETNRERWALIFLTLGGGVFFGNIVFPGIDPTVYMQFLLAIGSLFIVGASGDSWIKAYSVKSVRQTEMREETKQAEIKSREKETPNKEVALKAESQYSDDPSYAPLSWVETQENE